jgi:putative transposase
LGAVVQWFKTMTTNEYIRGVKQLGWPPFHATLWQRNYYEHIIRDEQSLDRIREYIDTNPQCWQLDRDNPASEGISEFYLWLESFGRPKPAT